MLKLQPASIPVSGEKTVPLPLRQTRWNWKDLPHGLVEVLLDTCEGLSLVRAPDAGLFKCGVGGGETGRHPSGSDLSWTEPFQASEPRSRDKLTFRWAQACLLSPSFQSLPPSPDGFHFCLKRSERFLKCVMTASGETCSEALTLPSHQCQDSGAGNMEK